MTHQESLIVSNPSLSLVSGPPLSEEQGIGALTLGGWLREVRDRYGDKEALVLHENGERISWSYNDLWDRANEVAKSLLACGAGKGTRVGILMTNRPEFLSAFFGVSLAGGVATTISTFSTAAELEYMVDVSGVSILLLERKILKKDFADMVQELEPDLATVAPGELKSTRFPFLRHVASFGEAHAASAIESWQEFLNRGKNIPDALVEAASNNIQPADPGILFFSSGSTGKPKGILSAHRSPTLQMWRWVRWNGLGENVRCWSANGFFWSGNFAWAMGGTLSSGGTMVLQKVFQPEEALELMDKEKVSFLVAWPHQWAQLTDAKNWLDVDLSSMRYIDRNSPVASHPTIDTDWIEAGAAYGNTETFTLSSVYPANTPEEVRAGSHGLPVAGNTFKIVDPLTDEIKPIGEAGEIAVKGPTLMLGYLGIPLDETLDDQGFFRTGDGGYIDKEGRLFWEGRLNDIIKTGGANVSPIEIDNVIAQCPGVKVTKTVGIPDELLGELVVTCIVPLDGVKLSEEQIRSHAKKQLASYKVPRRVLFFNEDELETTGTNKIKSSELKALAGERLQAEAVTS